MTNLYICTVVCRYEEEESGYREMKQTDSGQGEKQMDKEKKTTDGDMKQTGQKEEADGQKMKQKDNKKQQTDRKNEADGQKEEAN